jgi:hypothetical protein
MTDTLVEEWLLKADQDHYSALALICQQEHQVPDVICMLCQRNCSARAIFFRHCEERSDEAIPNSEIGDCFAAKSAARNDRLSSYVPAVWRKVSQGIPGQPQSGLPADSLSGPPERFMPRFGSGFHYD